MPYFAKLRLNKCLILRKIQVNAECAIIERKGFTEGDEVIHEHFGNGIIRNIYDGGAYCEVEFFDSGNRSLRADKLKKA